MKRSYDIALLSLVAILVVNATLALTSTIASRLSPQPAPLTVQNINQPTAAGDLDTTFDGGGKLTTKLGSRTSEAIGMACELTPRSVQRWYSDNTRYYQTIDTACDKQTLAAQSRVTPEQFDPKVCLHDEGREAL